MAEYINSYIPGQISLSNYLGGNPAPTYLWAPGQYAKLESNQTNWDMIATHNHMPNPYLPDSTLARHVDSVFGELDRKKWMRGILMDLDWGKIETSDGVYDWTFVDFVMDTIRTLPKTTGQDKKVIFLIDTHSAANLDIGTLLPTYLKTQPATNGGYYKNTTSFPPANVNPSVNAKKYDHIWCYEAGNPSVPGTPIEPQGYHFNFFKFADAAGTNTFKTKFYAFLAAIATRYNNDEVLAGVMVTESAIASPFVAYEAGNSRDANYAGRLAWLKYLKTIFTTRPVMEAVSFDRPYYRSMTDAGVTDGLIANRLSFTTANYHTGTNLNLGNILPVLSGKVPIIMQAQGLDMRSMSGNRPQYYNWPTNPTQLLSGDGINYNDPPTAQWLFDRARYFKSNLFIIQRNYDTSTNPNQQNWPKWKTFMDGAVASPNGGLLKDDQYGGMNPTEPLIVV